MNHLKFRILFALSSLLALTLALPAHAGSVEGADLTIYNSGRALVKEARSVTLPKGLASVVFKDMPVTLDPTSVRASGKDITVQDLQFSYLPITKANILDRYIGKELTLIMPDPVQANARVQRKATLLSNEDRPVFLMGKEVYVGDYDGLLFPALPKGLQQEPTLTLTIDSKQASKRAVSLDYIMDGLGWRADYALTVNKNNTTAALDAWATIDNNSQRGFIGTSLKLVAGEVNTGGTRPRAMLAKRGNATMDMEMAAAPAAPAEEQFSQYHVYTVPQQVNLAPAGTKQLSLFSSPKIQVRQELSSRYHSGPSPRNGKIKQRVDSTLHFVNNKANGLGRPMPGGLVRVFMPTKDGSQILAGEANMPHRGVGGNVKLALGRSFDVTVERVQTAFKRLGKTSYQVDWAINIKNGRETQQELRLEDSFPGQWKVLKASHKLTRLNQGTLQCKLMVPPTRDGKPMTVTYTVQVNY